jgi:hypothetical protein
MIAWSRKSRGAFVMRGRAFAPSKLCSHSLLALTMLWRRWASGANTAHVAAAASQSQGLAPTP